MKFTFLWEDTADKTSVNKCIHTFISETGRCYEESKGGDVFENGWGLRLMRSLMKIALSRQHQPHEEQGWVPEPGSGIANSKTPGGDSLGSFNEQQWLLSLEPLN